MKLIFFLASVVQQIGDIPWAQSTHAHFDFIHKNFDSVSSFFLSLNITQRQNLIRVLIVGNSCRYFFCVYDF